MANVVVLLWHLLFKLLFLLLRVNDKLGGSTGGGGVQRPPRYGLGVFLEFQYLMVSRNTLLGNPNFGYSESLPPCSRGRRQYAEPC